MKGTRTVPVMRIVLFVAWLVLNQSVSIGHLALAALFAIVIPRVLAPFLVDAPDLHRPRAIVRLALRVLHDIVVANIGVARMVLGRESKIAPGFVWVPLSIRDRHALVALAGIVSLTPGTVSAELTADSRHLLVHALDLADEDELISTIQKRYETPLREIFE